MHTRRSALAMNHQRSLLFTDNFRLGERFLSEWEKRYKKSSLLWFQKVEEFSEFTSCSEDLNGLCIVCCEASDLFLKKTDLREKLKTHCITTNSRLILLFDKEWLEFFQEFPQSLPLPIAPGFTFLFSWFSLAFNNFEKMAARKEENAIETSLSQQNTFLNLEEKSELELKNTLKISLYQLLPEIEKNNVHLKISLPDCSVAIFTKKNLLIHFLTEHFRYLLNELKGEKYTFLEVRLAVESSFCFLRILHSEILTKKKFTENFVQNCDTTETVLRFSLRNPDKKETPIKRTRPKILVIEDEIVMLDMIISMFEEQNYEIHGFHLAEDAVKALSKEQYDLILTDINIPNINGFQLIEIARKNELNKNTKIIAMTGLHNEYTLKIIQDLKLDGFISKPFSIDLLFETVHRLLQ